MGKTDNLLSPVSLLFLHAYSLYMKDGYLGPSAQTSGVLVVPSGVLVVPSGVLVVPSGILVVSSGIWAFLDSLVHVFGPLDTQTH